MKIIKISNKNNNELTLTNKAPLILQVFDFKTGVNIYSSKSMNQDGASYHGNTLDVGNVDIKFTVSSKNKIELERNKNNIRKIFNPKLGELKIVSGDKKVNCIVTELPFFSPISKLVSTCLINLKAHDPYWQDLQESKVEIAKWQPNLEFPLDIPSIGLEMGYREPSLIVNVINQGQVKTGLRLQFKALATLENPSLFNINTREYFKINKVMEAGEVIEVTTEFQNKRVKLIKNGVTTTFHNWDYTSSWLQLEVGDNLFRYDADNGIDNLECSIYFTNKYLGE